MTAVSEPLTVAAITRAIADAEQLLEATRRAIPRAQLVAARDFLGLGTRPQVDPPVSEMQSLIAELVDRIAGLQSLARVTEYNSLADVVNERSKEYAKATATIDDLERQLKALKHHEIAKRDELQARIASARADRTAEADHIAPLQRRIAELRPLLDGVESELRDAVLTGWLLHPPRHGQLAGGLNF